VENKNNMAPLDDLATTLDAPLSSNKNNIESSIPSIEDLQKDLENHNETLNLDLNSTQDSSTLPPIEMPSSLNEGLSDELKNITLESMNDALENPQEDNFSLPQNDGDSFFEDLDQPTADDNRASSIPNNSLDDVFDTPGEQLSTDSPILKAPSDDIPTIDENDPSFSANEFEAESNVNNSTNNDPSQEGLDILDDTDHLTFSQDNEDPNVFLDDNAQNNEVSNQSIEIDEEGKPKNPNLELDSIDKTDLSTPQENDDSFFGNLNEQSVDDNIANDIPDSFFDDIPEASNQSIEIDEEGNPKNPDLELDSIDKTDLSFEDNANIPSSQENDDSFFGDLNEQSVDDNIANDIPDSFFDDIPEASSEELSTDSPIPNTFSDDSLAVDENDPSFNANEIEADSNEEPLNLNMASESSVQDTNNQESDDHNFDLSSLDTPDDNIDDLTPLNLSLDPNEDLSTEADNTDINEPLAQNDNQTSNLTIDDSDFGLDFEDDLENNSDFSLEQPFESGNNTDSIGVNTDGLGLGENTDTDLAQTLESDNDLDSLSLGDDDEFDPLKDENNISPTAIGSNENEGSNREITTDPQDFDLGLDSDEQLPLDPYESPSGFNDNFNNEENPLEITPADNQDLVNTENTYKEDAIIPSFETASVQRAQELMSNHNKEIKPRKKSKRTFSFFRVLAFVLVAIILYSVVYKVFMRDLLMSPLEKGLKLIRKHDYSQANALFNQERPNLEWYQKYARAFMDQSAFELSKEKILGVRDENGETMRIGALDKAPYNKKSLMLLAELYIKQKEFSQAFLPLSNASAQNPATLSYLQDKYPNDYDVQTLTAQAYIEWGKSLPYGALSASKFNAASDIYYRMMREDPKNYHYYSKLLEISLLTNDRVPEKIRQLQNRGLDNKLDTKTLAQLGLYYLGQDQLNNATDVFNLIKTRKDAIDPEVFLMIGRYYTNMKDYNNAEDNFIKGIYSNSIFDDDKEFVAPKNPIIHAQLSNELGQLYVHHIYDYLGTTPSDQKNKQKFKELAQYHFDQAKKYNPKDPMTYYLNGNLTYAIDHNYPKAIHELTTAYELLNRENAPVPKDLSYNLGNALYKDGQYDRSLQVLSDLRSNGNQLNYPTVEYLMAMDYLKKGIYVESVTKFNSSLSYFDDIINKAKQGGVPKSMIQNKSLYFTSVINNNLGAIYQNQANATNDTLLKNKARLHFFNAKENASYINPSYKLAYPSLNLQDSLLEDNLQYASNFNVTGRTALIYEYTPNFIGDYS
jgi:hypothetical protein